MLRSHSPQCKGRGRRKGGGGGRKRKKRRGEEEEEEEGGGERRGGRRERKREGRAGGAGRRRRVHRAEPSAQQTKARPGLAPCQGHPTPGCRLLAGVQGRRIGLAPLGTGPVPPPALPRVPAPP